MSESAPVLSVRGLTVSFDVAGGWKEVVRDISFDVGPCETVAIVGESGSGKSVTSLAIMQLLDPEQSRLSGSVRLNGEELLGKTPAQMREIRGSGIGMVFQEPMTSLNPAMTIGAQIAEALVAHKGISWKAAEAEAVRLLEKVRIPAPARRFHDYPHRLSGGMRQRVMIAIALACSPRLLIADEPTTALDVTIQAEILDLIRQLQREEGMSVLFITHDMGVVAEVADRTVVMYHGDVVEQGSTLQIFREAAHPYTRGLISAVPELGSMTGIDQPQRYPVLDIRRGEVIEPARIMEPTVRTDVGPILSLRDLKVRFDIHSGLFGRVSGRVHAVENVSFDLQPGETLAIVGESGSGKSTIGRAITQLVTPTSGNILVNGQSIRGLGAEAKRQMRQTVQMIFQDPFASLDPRKSVLGAIAAPLKAHGIASGPDIRRIVADLLVKVGLDPAMMHRRPHEFSGGQRQRICIARALALRPGLLVADEAVSALDVSIKAQIINLLLDLQQELGLSYVFISHDMAAVERLSHRIAVMYLGEIVEIGPREAVFANPQHPYTRRLLSAVPVADPARRAIERALPPVGEAKNAVRPRNFQPPRRRYVTVAPGHLVMAEA